MPEQDSLEPTDQAIKNRLAKLNAIPVDTTGLRGRIDAMLVEASPAPSRGSFHAHWRGLTALAAVLVVAVMAGLVLMSMSNTPAMASPADLARYYDQAVTMDGMQEEVQSLAEANRVLIGRWREMPVLPQSNSGDLHACCIRDFKGKKTACLLIREGQTPLTLVVAWSYQIRTPEGRVVQLPNGTFTIHQSNGVWMATTQQGGRFICLMGKVSEALLLQSAAGLRF